MPEPAAVIFDMDGVLIDSYQAHFDSWRRLAAEHGREMTADQFAATFGRTSREIIREFWGNGEMSPEDIAMLDDRKERFYREIIAEDFPVMDGAGELIDALHAADFRLAVGSSGPPENVELVLAMLDRAAKFGAAVTGMDVTRGKPDPQVFLTAAKKVGVSPAHCVVVEDAPVGIVAAQAAGMKSVGLASTGRTEAELSDADLVVTSLRNLGPLTMTELLRPADSLRGRG